MNPKEPAIPPLLGFVALAQVADVRRSIAIYGDLGFAVQNTFEEEGAEGPTWAWLESGAASLMVGKAEAPVISGRQGVLFYLYCTDVPATHTRLRDAGHTVGEITKPFYSPGGEFRIDDPDGYTIIITHGSVKTRRT